MTVALWLTEEPWEQPDHCISNFVVRLIEITTGETWPYEPPCTKRKCPVHWEANIDEDFTYLRERGVDAVLASVYRPEHRLRKLKGDWRKVDLVRERVADRLRRQKPVFAVIKGTTAYTGFPNLPPGFVVYRRWSGQALLFANVDLTGGLTPKRAAWVSLDVAQQMTKAPVPAWSTAIARRDWSDSWRPPNRPTNPLIRALWAAARQHDAAAFERATEAIQRLCAQPDWKIGKGLPEGMAVERWVTILLEAKGWIDEQRKRVL